MNGSFSVAAAAIIAALGLAMSPAFAQDNGAGPETPPPDRSLEQTTPRQDEPQPPAENRSARAPDCPGLPDHDQLASMLREVVVPGDPSANGGLGNHMWAAVVNRAGIVCAIARSGESFGEQWPGSRGIAIAKAHSANAFSLPEFALSTANLYWPSQPGGTLYGLEASHIPAAALHEGAAEDWGTENDSLIGRPAGGLTVFAGGLALYTAEGELVGALGLSGDQPCTDHVIAWKMRDGLGLDHVPDGVTKAHSDNIIHDITFDPSKGRQTSRSGYGHPTCSPTAERIAEEFAATHPIGGTQ